MPGWSLSEQDKILLIQNHYFSSGEVQPRDTIVEKTPRNMAPDVQKPERRKKANLRSSVCSFIQRRCFAPAGERWSVSSVFDIIIDSVSSH
jgi:hypothetical protein